MSFFCDNCGEKVDIDSDECPSCGVLFKAVKCPRCAYSGKAQEFEKGCPSCGYLSQNNKNDLNRITLYDRHEKKQVWKQYLSDKTFWLMGCLLLLLIPFLIYLLLTS